jgi:hypothetical protein
MCQMLDATHIIITRMMHKPLPAVTSRFTSERSQRSFWRRVRHPEVQKILLLKKVCLRFVNCTTSSTDGCNGHRGRSACSKASEQQQQTSQSRPGSRCNCNHWCVRLRWVQRESCSSSSGSSSASRIYISSSCASSAQSQIADNRRASAAEDRRCAGQQ